MKKLFLLAILLTVAPFVSKAQEEEEDLTKMIREVVSLEMDRPKVVTPPPVAAVEEHTKGKKKKKKPVEELPPPEEVFDTLSPTVPASVTEMTNRATAWLNGKSKKFKKEEAYTSGGKVGCKVKFPYKPKVLNPTADVEGEITMKITIDFKEGKYRYTIDNIEHKATRGVASGGDIFNETPACGSLSLNHVMWNQIRGAAKMHAGTVAEDLKAKMKNPVSTESKSEW
ncbi:MAG: hypothetical protein Q8M29_11950 [Bacteroidota bacterium]|nr:hypothetical protein [Bacteroidota bacterium]